MLDKMKESLKRLCVENEDNNIVKTYAHKEDVEKAIMRHDTDHFQKSNQSIEHHHKRCKRLRNDAVRDRILRRLIKRRECNGNKAWQFL